MTSDHTNKPISPDVESKIREVLGKNFDYAISVVAYSETKSLIYNYTGMAEFRDALTHVKRAVFADNDNLAISEMDSAAEHIRRAAVESMQEYVETRYKSVRDRAYTPVPKYYSILQKGPNIKLIKEKEELIKEYIFKGREAKPQKNWEDAIAFFQKAEEVLIELDMILPTKKQLNFGYAETILAFVFLIVGMVLAHAFF